MATGHYIYIDHLLCLAGRRPSHPIDLPQRLWPVNTPLNPGLGPAIYNPTLTEHMWTILCRGFTMVSGWVLLIAR